MEDWSLQAIVSGEYAKMNFDHHMEMNGQDPFSYVSSDASCHPRHHEQLDSEFLTSFHEIFDVPTGSSEDLKELYKPFYSANDSNSSLPAQTVLDFQGPGNNKVVAEDHKPAQDSDQSTGTSSVVRRVTTGNYTPKYKKRKNQQIKRVVIQVSGEGLASDMWAWRKYGQKPIKGSPYPRSYYRCSSSKGCLARKQVEQSCTDQGMFIVTYTAEHSHSQPTRRNSLAGTVRQKFTSHKNPNRTITAITPEKHENHCSPTSPKTLHRFDEVINNNNNNNNNNDDPRSKIKEEINITGNGDFDNYNDIIMSGDFVFDEDLFSSLEDFHDNGDHQFIWE